VSGAPPEGDLAIVGAGATGLFLAAVAARAGAQVALLEARDAPTRHSRAIGIHPPGLAALDRLGVAAGLRTQGIEVRRGLASAGDARTGVRPLGALDFGRTLPGPYRFVLTVPQFRTEAALEDALAAVAPDALRRGVRVDGWRDDGDGVTVELATGNGRETVRAGLLIACDGARGGAAERLGVPVDGGRYGDVYLMGDLADDVGGPGGVPLGPDAAIHLAPDGVVEAFPLPGGVRRWVVKTPRLLEAGDPRVLTDLVAARAGVRPDPDGATMLSSFGVQRRLPRRLAVGRVWLAGDAAHVVAPIGGQGMTLAWLGAESLVAAWRGHAEGRASLAEAADAYDAVQRRRARRAISRAAWNLRMGRATRWSGARGLLVRALLTPPLAGRMARTFTMQA
jgi:2-polyprenyl-6-methoxyphenol hydroxylase-like FAD-dependent oxidoreductase